MYNYESFYQKKVVSKECRDIKQSDINVDGTFPFIKMDTKNKSQNNILTYRVYKFFYFEYIDFDKISDNLKRIVQNYNALRK